MQASDLDAPEYLSTLRAAVLCCEDKSVHEKEVGLKVNSDQPPSSSVT